MEVEAWYACPACGEAASVPVEPDEGSTYEIVVDCPICCQPSVVRVELLADGSARAFARLE